MSGVTETARLRPPGTQGYNLYAYVANNPTTWVDPSGHSAQAAVIIYASSRRALYLIT